METSLGVPVGRNVGDAAKRGFSGWVCDGVARRFAWCRPLRRPAKAEQPHLRGDCSSRRSSDETPTLGFATGRQ